MLYTALPYDQRGCADTIETGNAYALWEDIKLRNGTIKSSETKSSIMQQLNNITLKQNETIYQFTARIRALNNQLKELKITFDPEMVRHVTFTGLSMSPDWVDPINYIRRQTDQVDMSDAALEQYLLSEETKINKKKAGSSISSSNSSSHTDNAQFVTNNTNNNNNNNNKNKINNHNNNVNMNNNQNRNNNNHNHRRDRSRSRPRDDRNRSRSRSRGRENNHNNNNNFNNNRANNNNYNNNHNNDNSSNYNNYRPYNNNNNSVFNNNNRNNAFNNNNNNNNTPQCSICKKYNHNESQCHFRNKNNNNDRAAAAHDGRSWRATCLCPRRTTCRRPIAVACPGRNAADACRRDTR